MAQAHVRRCFHYQWARILGHECAHVPGFIRSSPCSHRPWSTIAGLQRGIGQLGFRHAGVAMQYSCLKGVGIKWQKLATCGSCTTVRRWQESHAANQTAQNPAAVGQRLVLGRTHCFRWCSLQLWSAA